MFISITRVMLLSVCCLIAACQITAAPADGAAGADPSGRRPSVVAAGDARLDPLKPTVISWDGAVTIAPNILRDDLPLDLLEDQVRYGLNNAVALKGYPLQRSQGDIQLEVAMLFDYVGSDAKAWSAESGSLVLVLRQGRLVRWRGTAQIYFTYPYNAPLQQRRIEYAIGQLLYTWP